VVWTYSGVRPLFDDGASAAQAATRDYVLTLDAPAGQAALLSIFGGKITTYRRLAEAALARKAPYLPQASGRPSGWTGRESLPGGDFPIDGFEAQVAALQSRRAFLPDALARRLVRAYGTEADAVVNGARTMEEMGPTYGADLTDAELCYLARHEWAMTAQDVVWRRSKLGLLVSADDVARIDARLAALHPMPEPVA